MKRRALFGLLPVTPLTIVQAAQAEDKPEPEPEKAKPLPAYGDMEWEQTMLEAIRQLQRKTGLIP